MNTSWLAGWLRFDQQEKGKNHQLLGNKTAENDNKPAKIVEKNSARDSERGGWWSISVYWFGLVGKDLSQILQRWISKQSAWCFTWVKCRARQKSRTRSHRAQWNRLPANPHHLPAGHSDWSWSSKPCFGFFHSSVWNGGRRGLLL